MRISMTLAAALAVLTLAGCSQNTTDTAADAAQSAMSYVCAAASGHAAQHTRGAEAVGAAACGSTANTV